MSAKRQSVGQLTIETAKVDQMVQTVLELVSQDSPVFICNVKLSRVHSKEDCGVCLCLFDQILRWLAANA